jgi:ferrous iron transport protein B
MNKSMEKIIAIVGQPNAGKSTLFNVLSDIKASTSNFAGTSVKIAESLVNVWGDTIRVIDLPGLYSLNYSDNAEKVTLEYLMNNQVDLIINVVDGSLLARSLELTQELIEFGLPLVLAINMMDEARAKGLEIFPEELKKMLNLEVIPITALYGKGVKTLIETAYKKLQSQPVKANLIKYTKHIEKNILDIETEISKFTDNYKADLRFLAIKSIENPILVSEELLSRTIDLREKIANEIAEQHNIDCFEAISYERHHIAMKIAEKISKFTRKDNATTADKIDKILIHPIYGYFALILFFGLMFVLVFYFGSAISALMEPGISLLARVYQPLKNINIFIYLTVDGLFQGFAGALGIVLPYFLPLIFISSIFEETGYLSRVAFLVDTIIHKAGLHGKSVAAFILGIGCSVPAIYATRILDNERDRVLTAVLIPFVPCSARIAVIFALTAAFAGPLWAGVIFVFVLLVIGISGKLLSKFLKKPTGLILEIPNLRLPSVNVSLKKTWYKIQEFLKAALPFLILGSVVLSWVEYFGAAKYLNYVFYPVLHYVLDVPSELGSTLLFGFFRKELILVMVNQAMGVQNISQLPMSMSQVIVFIVFVTLYFPCFTTFVVIFKEFGGKVAAFSAIFSIVVATLSAFIFKIYFIFVQLFY